MTKENYVGYTEQQLLAMLRNGDRHAYGEIFQRYKRLLYLFGFKRLGNKEDVADILQDIFTSLWINREVVNISGTLNAYLHAAVRNKILDKIANKQVSAKYEQSFRIYCQVITETTDHRVRQQVLQEIIDREVSDLPPKMRQVFELSRKDNYNRKEIAEHLGISEETVKSRMREALKILKIKLKFSLVIINIYLIYLLTG